MTVRSEVQVDSTEIEVREAVLAVAKNQIQYISQSFIHNTDDTADILDDAIPEHINTTDPDELHEIYIAIEKQLKKRGAGGKVEFAVVADSGSVRVVLEAKLSFLTDKMAGFYEVCSYMSNVRDDFFEVHKVAPAVVYGVYTDYMNWQFLELRGTTITCSKAYTFTDAEGETLLKDAIVVFQFMLQAVGVPADFDFDFENTLKLKQKKTEIS